MKTIQVTGRDNRHLLRAAGVRRVYPGWYTVSYNGLFCDASTIVSASYNPGGNIRYLAPSRR